MKTIHLSGSKAEASKLAETLADGLLDLSLTSERIEQEFSGRVKIEDRGEANALEVIFWTERNNFLDALDPNLFLANVLKTFEAKTGGSLVRPMWAKWSPVTIEDWRTGLVWAIHRPADGGFAAILLNGREIESTEHRSELSEVKAAALDSSAAIGTGHWLHFEEPPTAVQFVVSNLAPRKLGL